MGSKRLYGLGVLMTLLGGSGLAEISTSSHGSFAICTVMFAIGLAICLTDFIK